MSFDLSADCGAPPSDAVSRFDFAPENSAQTYRNLTRPSDCKKMVSLVPSPRSRLSRFGGHEGPWVELDGMLRRYIGKIPVAQLKRYPTTLERVFRACRARIATRGNDLCQ